MKKTASASVVLFASVLFLESFWFSSSFHSHSHSPAALHPNNFKYQRHGRFCGLVSVRSTSGIGGVQDENSKKKKSLSFHSSSSSSSSSLLSHNPRQSHHSSWSLPRRAVELYTDYASRLWNETNMAARQRIAGDRSLRLIRQLQHVLREEKEAEEEAEGALSPPSSSSMERQSVLQACDRYLNVLEKSKVDATATVVEDVLMNVTKDLIVGDSDSNHDDDKVAHQQIQVAVASSTTTTTDDSLEPNKKKPRRSILFGAAMGLGVAMWVFSGNYIFTGFFTLMTILGQLEYYRMVINTGVYPARRISIVGACSMFVTALFTPNLHQICLPIFGLWAMVWFLTMKRTVTTIPEIATTFTGMFYLGYVPSFWVRIRLLNTVTGDGSTPMTQLAPLTKPLLDWIAKALGRRLPDQLTQAVHLPITTGAIFIFWTWLCLAFSDVGAYFVGRKFGKTKLGAIAPAAGATSPNKTVEGVVGGCAASAALAILGAWVQRWPYFVWTGAIHGILLGILGLVGDLTASMLKRDAGLKDFGDLIPEHGGIMDRVDSFVWTAPYSWLVCSYVIPALKMWHR